jgi:plasmid stabilization system protein ParE
MQRRLKVSKRAEANLQKIAAYISDNFGTEKAEHYVSEMEQQLVRIQNNPMHYPIEVAQKGIVHKAVFKRKTILLFRVTNQTVTITAINDARSDWKR